MSATDVHPDGYTVNATKYEAVAFVDDRTMVVRGGTYLLTVNIIPVTLNINDVVVFITTINGSGTESVDFQGIEGASKNLVVLRTVNPIPQGNYIFTLGLMPFSSTLPGTFSTLEREVELWVLPPAGRFELWQHMTLSTVLLPFHSCTESSMFTICRALQRHTMLKWWAVL